MTTYPYRAPSYQRSGPPVARAAAQSEPAEETFLLPPDDSDAGRATLRAAVEAGPAAQVRWIWREMGRRGYNPARRADFYRTWAHLIEDARFAETAALFEQAEAAGPTVPGWAR